MAILGMRYKWFVAETRDQTGWPVGGIPSVIAAGG